jgi:hypothetical protein
MGAHMQMNQGNFINIINIALAPLHNNNNQNTHSLFCGSVGFGNAADFGDQNNPQYKKIINIIIKVCDDSDN